MSYIEHVHVCTVEVSSAHLYVHRNLFNKYWLHQNFKSNVKHDTGSDESKIHRCGGLAPYLIKLGSLKQKWAHLCPQ